MLQRLEFCTFFCINEHVELSAEDWLYLAIGGGSLKHVRINRNPYVSPFSWMSPLDFKGG